MISKYESIVISLITIVGAVYGFYTKYIKGSKGANYIFSSAAGSKQKIRRILDELEHELGDCSSVDYIMIANGGGHIDVHSAFSFSVILSSSPIIEERWGELNQNFQRLDSGIEEKYNEALKFPD